MSRSDYDITITSRSGLPRKRLFPLNYTPKRTQSLKTTDFVPVADFTSQEVNNTCVR